MQVAFLLALAVPLLLMLHGALNLAGGGSGFSGVERIFYGSAQIIIAITVLVGLLLSNLAPRVGAALIVCGVVTISILMYWFVIVTIPVGLFLLWVAYRRRVGPRTPDTAPTDVTTS